MAGVRLQKRPTGSYNLEAMLDGFATTTAENVRLLLGSTPTVNFTLQSASVSESITVTAEVPVVEVTNTATGTKMQQEQIETLPIAGRDFKGLVLLTPQTRLDSERGNLSISGQRGINTNVTVDGVDYNNAFFGGAVGGAEGRAPLSISQESIKEFSVVTNGASVEFGRSTRGSVGAAAADGAILAPMPGKVTSVEVSQGEKVVKGQRLLTLEAMKMEHGLVAPFDGVVAELTAKAGAQVQVDAVLAKIEKSET